MKKKYRVKINGGGEEDERFFLRHLRHFPENKICKFSCTYCKFFCK